MTKTVVASSYGGPEVLEVHDIVVPQPGPDQVLFDVKAAGTNPVDSKVYSGYLGNDPPGAARDRCRLPSVGRVSCPGQHPGSSGGHQ